jgi:hypothetical protein
MWGENLWWRWTFRIALLGLLLLGARYHHLFEMVETESAAVHLNILLGAVAGLGLIVLARTHRRPFPIGWRDFLLLGPGVTLIVVWVLVLGMVHVSGYEHSLIANYGWLQLQGMRPHVDFPCTLSPHFYLGMKYAFTWFGPTFRSSVILTAIYASVSFTWAYLLLRFMDLSAASAALIALLAQSLGPMIAGYFWYNFVGENDSVILFLAALAWIDRPRSPLHIASVAMALALVMLDKPNGWVLPVCLAIAFLGSRQHRIPFLACVALSASVIALVAYFGPFDVAATLRVYGRLSEIRRASIAPNLGWMSPTAWAVSVEAGKLRILVATFLTVATVSLVKHRSGWRTADGRWWARLWTYAGALAMGIAVFLTDNELKCTALAVPIVGLAVWIAKCEPGRWHESPASLCQVVVVFGMWLSLFGLSQCLVLLGRGEFSTFVNRTPELIVPIVAFSVWVANCAPWPIGQTFERIVYGAASTVAAVLLLRRYEPAWTDLAAIAIVVTAILGKIEPRRRLEFLADPRQVALVLGVWLALFCLCQGLYDGWTRYRVYAGCRGGFWQPEISDTPPVTAFMAGVRGGPELVGLMEQLDRAVSKHPDEKIFFGPFLELAYPAFGRKPPAGFPVWWHAGTSYFPGDASTIVDAFGKQQFDVLIIFHNAQFYQMPDEVPRLVKNRYEVSEAYRGLTVYRKKTK